MPADVRKARAWLQLILQAAGGLVVLTQGVIIPLIGGAPDAVIATVGGSMATVGTALGLDRRRSQGGADDTPQRQHLLPYPGSQTPSSSSSGQGVQSDG